VVREEPQFSYIDGEAGHMIEQKKFVVSWGHLSLSERLPLTKVQKTAFSEISYKRGGLESLLPPECYLETPEKNNCVVSLKNRQFFENNSISEVFHLTRLPIGSEYGKRIELRSYPTCLEIINENPYEVKNFRLILPHELDLRKITRATEFIDCIRVEVPLPLLGVTLNRKMSRCGEIQSTVSVVVRKLPAKQGNIPGKISVPLP
jgi:hypothetical protein